MIALTERFKVEEPQARVGLLDLECGANLPSHPELTAARLDLEQELRDRYGGLDRKQLRELPVFSAYDSFYKRFRKSYHVQLQLESVAFQGKPIGSPSALVLCMFMAELKTGLLTAGHDFAALDPPLEADIAAGGESYQLMGGAAQQLKSGDLYIRDQQGILSSIIYGPDRRTAIRENTGRAVFTTYGPPGISPDQVREELILLEDYIRLFSPQAKCHRLTVL
jgi:DNA/RNA-binding domain of Phe-tRNA-synthetase-like protein